MGNRTYHDYLDCCAIKRHFLTNRHKNIQTKVKDFNIKCHQNNVTSVNLIVEELRNEPYNPLATGRTEPKCPTLQDETFVLTPQTKFQKNLYKALAYTILCIDSTHGTNQYRLLKLLAFYQTIMAVA